jgi:hypothetical protein
MSVEPILFISTTPHHCSPLYSQPVIKTTLSQKAASTAVEKSQRGLGYPGERQNDAYEKETADSLE